MPWCMWWNSEKQLSVTDPDKNLCLVSLLQDSLKAYNALPNDKPFIHRYITDLGVSLSSPERHER